MGAKLAAPGGEGQGGIGVVFILRGCCVFASGFSFGLASRCVARRWSRPAGVGGPVGGHHAGAGGVVACGAVRPFVLRPGGLAGGSGPVSFRCGPGAGWRSFGIGKTRAVVRRRRGGPGGLRARFRSLKGGDGWGIGVGRVAGSLDSAVGCDRGAGRGLGGRGHRRSGLVSQGAIGRSVGGHDAGEWCLEGFLLCLRCCLLRWRAGSLRRSGCGWLAPGGCRQGRGLSRGAEAQGSKRTRDRFQLESVVGS
jgi:hypothetical protein